MTRTPSDPSFLRSRYKLVLLAYSVRSFVALLLGWPLAQSFSPGNVAALPGRGRELFAPGASLLLPLLAQRSRELLPWWQFGWTLGLLAVLVGAVVTTVIFSALAVPTEVRASVWLCRSVRRVPANVALTLSGWIAFGGILFLARTLYALVPTLIYPFFGEKGADVALGLLFLAVAFAGLITLTIVDLARAENSQEDSGLRQSLAVALECLGDRFCGCITGPLSYCILAIALPIVVEANLLPAVNQTTGRLLLTLAMHQLAVLGICALHLRWWHFAIRLVALRQPV